MSKTIVLIDEHECQCYKCWPTSKQVSVRLVNPTKKVVVKKTVPQNREEVIYVVQPVRVKY